MLRNVYMLLLLTGVGCSAMPRPTGDLSKSDPAAAALLDRAIAAQGRLDLVRDVSVRFDGKWLSGLVNKLQPVLVDEAFRQGSEERLLLDSSGSTTQVHTGLGGTKYVLRTPTSTAVWYNGQPATDADVLASSALVADAYRLFLLGPHFLTQRKAILVPAGKICINGAECDQVLAILKPGIGGPDEDRVLLAIDRHSSRVRRIRMTLNALNSTRGAVVDVTPSDYVQIAGVWWPTAFFEELIRPFPASVHRWRMTGIDLNRGLTSEMIAGPSPQGPATRPAGSIELPSPAAVSP